MPLCLRFHGSVKAAAPAPRAPRRMRDDEREWLGRAKVLPARAAPVRAAAGVGWAAAGKVLAVSECGLLLPCPLYAKGALVSAELVTAEKHGCGTAGGAGAARRAVSRGQALDGQPKGRLAVSCSFLRGTPRPLSPSTETCACAHTRMRSCPRTASYSPTEWPACGWRRWRRAHGGPAARAQKRQSQETPVRTVTAARTHAHVCGTSAESACFVLGVQRRGML